MVASIESLIVFICCPFKIKMSGSKQGMSEYKLLILSRRSIFFRWIFWFAQMSNISLLILFWQAVCHDLTCGGTWSQKSQPGFCRHSFYKKKCTRLPPPLCASSTGVVAQLIFYARGGNLIQKKKSWFWWHLWWMGGIQLSPQSLWSHLLGGKNICENALVFWQPWRSHIS